MMRVPVVWVWLWQRLKGWRTGLLLALTGLLVLFAFRVTLLRSLSEALVAVDEPFAAEAIFVLAGNALDRGNKAAELWKAGYAPRIICLGKLRNRVLYAFQIEKNEAEVTRAVVLRAGVAPGAVELLEKATSTYEECAAILAYCRQREIQKIIIVSNRLHTARIRGVVDDLFAAGAPQVRIVGANSTEFDHRNWWKKEAGLLFVNNEWMKRLYYWYKY